MTELREQFDRIRHADPLIAVLALGAYRSELAGKREDASAKRDRCLANYGLDFVISLDVCVEYFRLYGDPAR